MKQEKTFDSVVWLAVIAVHIAALSAAWQGKPPRVSVGASVLQVVDLGDFQAGNNETPAPPAPAVEKPKPVVQPEKPVKKKITAVKKPDKKPDIVVKKEEIKPEPEPQPEPPKPVEEPAPKAVETPAADAHGTGTGTGQMGENTGGNAGGGGTGAGGGGATAASHIGGHLHNPKPPYPQRSIENGEEGVVRLRVTVEANGRPSAVSLVKSSGYPALDRSALKTVREQYRFIPATRAGVAVRSDYTFGIKFELP